MDEEIKETVKNLKSGKTILYPTDTVWGLGCDATNPRAVEKIYKIKRRVESKSMIVLLDNADKLEHYINKVPEITWDLLESIDTPLTIVYPEAKNLARNVVARDNTIAIRITNDEFCKTLIREFGKPIVSSSANLSGEPAPIIFSQVSNVVRKEVDYIVKLHHQRISKTKPSTIIKIQSDGHFKVIRN